MNKELIEALEECQKAFDNLCGNSMMYKPLRVNIKKALQKAKEQPTNAEEFLKNHTPILVKSYKGDKAINPFVSESARTQVVNHLSKLLSDLLESYSNQSKKTITEEEIEKECWERYNLYNSPFWRGKREGFLECAKWIREKLK